MSSSSSSPPNTTSPSITSSSQGLWHAISDPDSPYPGQNAIMRVDAEGVCSSFQWLGEEYLCLSNNESEAGGSDQRDFRGGFFMRVDGVENDWHQGFLSRDELDQDRYEEEGIYSITWVNEAGSSWRFNVPALARPREKTPISSDQWWSRPAPAFSPAVSGGGIPKGKEDEESLWPASYECANEADSPYPHAPAVFDVNAMGICTGLTLDTEEYERESGPLNSHEAMPEGAFKGGRYCRKQGVDNKWHRGQLEACAVASVERVDFHWALRWTNEAQRSWLIWVLRKVPARAPRLPNVSDGLHGYVGMEVGSCPGFDQGVSFYTPAWPLLDRGLRNFQIGLPSIWLIPDNRDATEPLCPVGTCARDNWPERAPTYRDVFQTIEGGQGFWGNTRFPSKTSKFRMNGTPNGYTHQISSPGWGFGGDELEAQPAEQLCIAQLSNRLLVPPDGLTFAEGTSGGLFGNAWMALPLLRPYTLDSAGAVGGQCWTCFVNAENYKGPLAFWVPSVWARISHGHAPARGRTLDTKHCIISGGAMEINTVPRFSVVENSTEYSRIPRLRFPVDTSNTTVMMQDLTLFSGAALAEPLGRWLDAAESDKGGLSAPAVLDGLAAPSGEFDTTHSQQPEIRVNPLQLSVGPKQDPIVGLATAVETVQLENSSYGLRWKCPAPTPGYQYLPDHFRKERRGYVPVARDDVPEELQNALFDEASGETEYTSPPSRGPEAVADTVWATPGPASAPTTVLLSDGSEVTYCWYRFADQPALQAHGLTLAQKQRLQMAAELMHVQWRKDGAYMPPPSSGTLASLDKAIVLTPPPGLEIGYVPIAFAQRLARRH